MQIHQRQHLGHLRALPTPRGQDLAAEPAPFTRVRVDSLVVHPRRHDLDRAVAITLGRVRPLPTTSRQPSTSTSSAMTAMTAKVGVPLRFQRRREHPSRTLPADRVQIERQLRAGIIIYSL